MNFPGGFVVFLFFLTSEERVPKQLKQVSIVVLPPVIFSDELVDLTDQLADGQAHL